MELRWIDSGGTAHERAVGDLAGLLTRPDGWVWLDVAEPDEVSMASIVVLGPQWDRSMVTP